MHQVPSRPNPRWWEGPMNKSCQPCIHFSEKKQLGHLPCCYKCDKKPRSASGLRFRAKYRARNKREKRNTSRKLFSLRVPNPTFHQRSPLDSFIIIPARRTT